MPDPQENLPPKSLTSTDGVDLDKHNPEDETMNLFRRLVYILEQSPKIKKEDIPSEAIFQIYNMPRNPKSKIFSDSSAWVSPEVSDTLLEQGIIQKIASEDSEKFTLTFKGIAQCIQKEYGVSLEDQFMQFLGLSDRKFNTTEQSQLSWKEKLACLSLILLASTSDSSSIRLDNEANKAVLTEVFQKTLTFLKEHNMVRKEKELKTVHRGEDPVSGHMSRLTALPRKTNHYYRYGRERARKRCEYFLDVEKNGQVVSKRVFFLLKKIFENYKPNSNYEEMYRELAAISQLYYPRFQARSISPTTALSILRILKDFLNRRILELPLQMQP